MPATVAKSRTAAPDQLPDHADRPPGSVPEARFTELCDQCGQCVEICPKESIGMDADGYPFLSGMDECGRCALCADVCTRGAIDGAPSSSLGGHVSETDARALAKAAIAAIVFRAPRG